MSLKACVRGRSVLRLQPVPHLFSSRDYTFSSSSTSPAEVASATSLVFCRLNSFSRFHSSSYFYSASSRLLHPVSRLGSPPAHCCFCTQGGSDGDEELSVENEGIEGVIEEEDGDDVDLLSELQPPLPDFKDPVEEAAYIGYKIVGHVKPGDFGSYRPPKAFAVVQVGSHQFKISPGDCIYTEKLKFADVNDKLSLEKVLLLGSKSQTIIGRPLVPKAYVHAAVEEQVLDAKVIVFKKKRRKNYRRCNGHRQELTRLRILEIWGLGEARSALV